MYKRPSNKRTSTLSKARLTEPQRSWNLHDNVQLHFVLETKPMTNVFQRVEYAPLPAHNIIWPAAAAWPPKLTGQYVASPMTCSSSDSAAVAVTHSALTGSQQRFSCSCSKVFKRRSDLVRHHKTHTDERWVRRCRFSCLLNQCVDLRSHRIFRCDHAHCEKAFVQKSALIIHMRTQ